MLIDNVIWHARVDVFIHLSQKYQTPESFIIHTFLCCSFFYFMTGHLYKFYSVLNCIMNSYLRMLTKLPKVAKITIFLLLCIPSLLFCCGDIEKNPGPKYLPLTFCHWNLNCLKAHNSIKISLLQPYLTQHYYDVICLSETFLNSSYVY